MKISSTGMTNQFQTWLERFNAHHDAFYWLWAVLAVVFGGYVLWRYVAAVAHRPKFTKQDIIYQEYFASGNSLKNILTRMGGASSCLRLVVTKDVLWVTSWFPFSLFAAVYDLEHVIPLQNIRSVEGKKTLGLQSLQLTYVDGAGKSHALRIKPKNTQAFLDTLERSSARTGAMVSASNVVPEEPVPSLPVALKKYWPNLLAVGLFPTVFFVLCGNFHVPFPLIVPLFFATMFYGMWPGIAKKVPYTYQFVMGAVWLGGGLVGGVVASLFSMLLGKHHP